MVFTRCVLIYVLIFSALVCVESRNADRGRTRRRSNKIRRFICVPEEHRMQNSSAAVPHRKIRRTLVQRRQLKCQRKQQRRQEAAAINDWAYSVTSGWTDINGELMVTIRATLQLPSGMEHIYGVMQNGIVLGKPIFRPAFHHLPGDTYKPMQVIYKPKIPPRSLKIFRVGFNEDNSCEVRFHNFETLL